MRLLALTNWSAELFPHARERFAFLRLFEAVVVSGEERLAKPDPRIYDLLLSRHGLDPAGTVFVDDREANVEAARAAGMTGLVFTDRTGCGATSLRAGVLPGCGGTGLDTTRCLRRAAVSGAAAG